MKLAKGILANAIVGAIFFWFPDIVIHKILINSNIQDLNTKIFIGGYVFNTILCPAFAVLGFLYLDRFKNDFIHPYSRAKWQLLGIWLFGPIVIVAINGLGIRPDQTIIELYLESLYGVLVFPFFTFISSIYDCTFFAVILVIPILHVVGKKRESARTIVSS